MKFIPNGDMVAIKKTPLKSETSAGVIYTQPENRLFAKGKENVRRLNREYARAR